MTNRKENFTHRGFDVAAIWIFALSVENFLVQLNIVVVNGIIESDGDHLRNIFVWQITGNGCAVFRAETIWQNTNSWITWWSAIWIAVVILVKREKAKNVLITK